MTDQFIEDYKRDTLAGLVGRIETLEALLKRISEWDMMDETADGPYWRREIADALNQQNPDR